MLIVGMRAGKSYTMGITGGYIEHFISAIGARYPGSLHNYLGIEKSETFEVTYAASTATQAKDTVYAKYRKMRTNSPWINKYMNWAKAEEAKQIGVEKWEYKPLDNVIEDGYLNVKYNRIASDSSGVAGRTRIMGSIDELARLDDTDSKRSAKELYRVINQSLKTIRSAGIERNLPPFLGLMGNVTSPLSLDDIAMNIYNRAKSGEIRKTYCWKGATWEFNPAQKREYFDDEYAKDPIGAERDYGANPPNADTPYILNPVRFWNNINWERKPLAKFNITHISDPVGNDYVAAKLEHSERDFSDRKYYLFCDAGVSFDAFSMVCAHSDWMSVDGSVNEQHNEHSVVDPPLSGPAVGYPTGGPAILGSAPGSAPGGIDYSYAASSTSYDHKGETLVTVFDFAMRVIPEPNRSVWFESIVDIVNALRQRIKIAAVCWDRWNSESSIQQIRSMNIMSYHVSLNASHFLNFRTMTDNNRVVLLPPDDEDRISISEQGTLQMGTQQEFMSGEGIGLVEILKLNRSKDLRKFYNPHKGEVRGRDSDDVAYSMVGCNFLVQDSIVDHVSDTGRKRDIKKRMMANNFNNLGTVFKVGG
jgi:hypothetical protein